MKSKLSKISYLFTIIAGLVILCFSFTSNNQPDNSSLFSHLKLVNQELELSNNTKNKEREFRLKTLYGPQTGFFTDERTLNEKISLVKQDGVVFVC